MLRELQADLATRLSPIPVLLGEESVKLHATPPRVVLVPTSESFADVRPTGAAVGARPLLARRVRVEARLWASRQAVLDQLDQELEPDPIGTNADDFAAVEQLIDRFVSALRGAVRASLQLEGGEWNGQAVSALGREYVLTFSVLAPVIMVTETQRTATVTDLPADVAVGDPTP